MSSQNPYAAAAPHSACYAAQGAKLVPCFNGAAAGPRAIHIHHLIRATIDSPTFPCVGAKAAVNKNTYRFAFYGAMDSEKTIAALCHDLYEFAQWQKQSGDNFTSLIACFDDTMFADGAAFEDGVWKMLGALATRDSAHHEWDKMASPDEEHADFAFSFAQTAYFVAALAPVTTRLSRRFVIPALVFNAHYQFENMKKEGRFELLRDKIRKNDEALEHGTSNAIAADFGSGVSEAVQYAGVTPQPGKAWKCPFHKYFNPQ